MFRDLRADEIECRVAQAKPKGVSLLLYKDARCDQNILDETVGAMNWMRHHCRENANCIVSIWDDKKQMWVDKEDTGTESNTEKEKGLASDSFKRACFNWGIGRELYTAPFIWVWAADCKELNLDDKTKKWKCSDTFTVADIKIEDKRIVYLKVTNDATGKTCFEWESGAKRPEIPQWPIEPPSTPAPKPADRVPKMLYCCDDCGTVITAYTTADGVDISPERHDAGSRKKFGKSLCIDCINKKKGEQT